MSLVCPSPIPPSRSLRLRLRCNARRRRCTTLTDTRTFPLPGAVGDHPERRAGEQGVGRLSTQRWLLEAFQTTMTVRTLPRRASPPAATASSTAKIGLPDAAGRLPPVAGSLVATSRRESASGGALGWDFEVLAQRTAGRQEGRLGARLGQYCSWLSPRQPRASARWAGNWVSAVVAAAPGRNTNTRTSGRAEVSLKMACQSCVLADE
ncbi:hypothetical protein OH76DRAFT_12330 [Lentinus brumalis]|uniref:Uncharacterized protein n=1 Tax=Lentinus brumalis TaxID=2498619 RepID=A0A371DWZ3_9APHY|nr:hypothetical protein OH76DRAFT_12330 [Polyporus brumalis]